MGDCDAFSMNQQFKAIIKFIFLIFLAIAGQLIINMVSEPGNEDYYSLSLLLITVVIFTFFGFILGGSDLSEYITNRLRVRTNYLKLSLGLAGLTIFITIGVLALFEPGNNFAPNGVFEFFLKSPVFTPLYLISCGYMLANSVEKYEGLF